MAEGVPRGIPLRTAFDPTWGCGTALTRPAFADIKEPMPAPPASKRTPEKRNAWHRI